MRIVTRTNEDPKREDAGDQEPQVDVSRRSLGAVLAMLGGAVGLSALAGCTDAAADENVASTAGADTAASLAGASTGFLYFDTIAGAGASLGATAGKAGVYSVAVALGYNAPGDGGGGLFYWDPRSVATGNGGTVLAVSGVASGRWVRLYDGSVNVRWFGARGAGGDDTNAILAAIRAAPSPVTGGAGTVFFPPGVYGVSSPIDLGNVAGERCDGIRLVGAGMSQPVTAAGAGGGTTIKCIGGGGPVIRGSAIGVTIEHMTLDGGGLANPVLQFWYISTLCTVRNVVVTGAFAPNAEPSEYLNGTLVELDGNQGAPSCVCEVDHLVFENVQIAQFTGNRAGIAVHVVGSNTFMSRMYNCMLGDGFNLVDIGGGAGIDFDNCQFNGCYQGMIRLDGLCQKMIVRDCYTEYGKGISFFYQTQLASDSPTPIRFEGNYINADNPIVLVPTQPMILSGNTFKGNVIVNAATPPAAGGAPVGNQTIFAMSNSFAAGATFAGTGMANVVAIGNEGTGAYPIGAPTLVGAPAVTGAKGGSAALGSLIQALVALRLIVDETTG
jgi:hypothetical protein